MENKMKAKIDFDVLKRVMKYLTKSYKLRIFFVIICLLVSTASSVAGNLYLQTLIDDYIVPLVGTQNPVYTSLIKAIAFSPFSPSLKYKSNIVVSCFLNSFPILFPSVSYFRKHKPYMSFLSLFFSHS